MKKGNKIVATELILLNFNSFLDAQLVLFLVFSIIYLLTLASNVNIMVMVRIDSTVPFISFFPSFIFIDLLFVIVPSMLANFLKEIRTI